MKTTYIVTIEDRELEVHVIEGGEQLIVRVDEQDHVVDLHHSLANLTGSMIIDGRAYEALTVPWRDGLDVFVSGDAFHVAVVNELWARAKDASGAAASGEEMIVSPMPGSVVKVMVSEGDVVEAGSPVVVVEAMKMQNELTTAQGGKVTKVHVKDGDVVDQDAPLVDLHLEEEPA